MQYCKWLDGCLFGASCSSSPFGSNVWIDEMQGPFVSSSQPTASSSPFGSRCTKPTPSLYDPAVFFSDPYPFTPSKKRPRSPRRRNDDNTSACQRGA